MICILQFLTTSQSVPIYYISGLFRWNDQMDDQNKKSVLGWTLCPNLIRAGHHFQKANSRTQTQTQTQARSWRWARVPVSFCRNRNRNRKRPSFFLPRAHRQSSTTTTTSLSPSLPLQQSSILSLPFLSSAFARREGFSCVRIYLTRTTSS